MKAQGFNTSGAVRLAAIVRRFWAGRDGATAVLFAISLVPTLMVVGAAVDYARLAHAQSAAQSATDSAALAAAISPIETLADMRKMAERYLDSNARGTSAEGATITDFSYDKETREVVVRTAGQIDTAILASVGIRTMDYAVTARAIRGTAGATEVALVLDNTWSMNGSRLAALKGASEQLVSILKSDPRADVRIAVVPYADYVNVGTQYRSAPWLAVPADRSETSPRTCQWTDVRYVCRVVATRTCTATVDGRVESYACDEQVCETQQVPKYEACWGGDTTSYRWFGCVGSRVKPELRTNDSVPSAPYPGLLGTSQNCLTPIVPLTASTSEVLNAIRAMVVNIGGYRPETYIPAGLIWGVNVLSPTAPFSEGAAYDRDNRRPRKVMVLMSDGEITLRLNPDTGEHQPPDSDPQTRAKQIAESYADMDRICTYAKRQGIEVYTVLLEVTDPTAQAAMRSCASSPRHYFDARDGGALSAAFQNIAGALNGARLTR